MKRITKWFQEAVVAFCVVTIFITFVGVATFVPSTRETLSESLIEAIKDGEQFFTFNSHGLNVVEILYPISKDPTLFQANYGDIHCKRIGDLWFMYIPQKYNNNTLCQAEIDCVANEIITELDIQNKSDFEKAYAIYNWICQNISYEKLDDCRDQDIYYALVHKKSVCAGMSKSFVYLLSKVGIDGSVISGKTIYLDEPMNHAWAVAYLNGVPYSFDITNDIGNQPDQYEYFAITSREIAKKYTISEYSQEITCSNNDCDLFVRNNAIIHNGSVDALIELAQKKNGYFFVKCSNDDIFNEAVKSLTGPEFKDRLNCIYGKTVYIEKYTNASVNIIGLSINQYT